MTHFFENKWGSFSATFYSSPEEWSVPRPTVIFAHGLGAQKEWYSWVGDCLANEGYSAFLFSVPSRRLMNPRQWSDGIRSAIDYLLNEEGPLRDRVCSEKIGVMGHSMGGLGALIAGSEDARVKCVVGLAPAVRPEYLLALKDIHGISVPVQLQIGSNDGLIPTEWVKTFLESVCSERKSYVEIGGGNHMRFADKTAGIILGEYLSRVGLLGFGGRRFHDRKAKITYQEQHLTTRRSFMEWFNRYLKQ